MYPSIEPHDSGMLEVGAVDSIYWEVCGNPGGKPAVVLHGGPGSGCAGWQRRLFDPERYRTVLFDQRNCGRSRPHASDADVDLSENITAKLIEDIERLRQHLGVEHWLVLGGSWGSTLALAYAETYPERVSELVLFGVTTGRHSEFDWLFRGGLGKFFPQQWERLCERVPETSDDVVEAYHGTLNGSDPEARRRAAEDWCLWESATVEWPPREGLADRFRDPDYALAFARIVTHFVRRNAWLEDSALLNGAGALAGIPGVLVNGRFDFQAPLGNAWSLKRAWPQAELVVVEDAGHSPASGVAVEVVRATDRFAGS